MDPRVEKLLLNRVAKGEEAVFRLLFDYYRDKVYYICFRLLQSDTLAEEALQEVFLKVWLRRKKLDEVLSFSLLLDMLITDEVYHMLRRQAAEEGLLHELAVYARHTGTEVVEQEVLRKELQSGLRLTTASLTPRQKQVFELSRLEGLSPEEIADRLHMSHTAVQKHINDIMEILRTQLHVEGQTFEYKDQH